MDQSGTSARPANANGIEVALSAAAGANEHSKFTTKSFEAGKAFKMQLSASASDFVCLFPIEPRSCLIWAHVHERAQFSVEG